MRLECAPGMHLRVFSVVAIVAAAGCVTSRQLSDIADPRLRTPASDAIVARTTERWRTRIDPSSALRFRSPDYGWTDRVSASDLHVDADGGWIERSTRPDAYWVQRLSPQTAVQLALARFPDVAIEQTGDGWILRGNQAALLATVGQFEMWAQTQTPPLETESMGEWQVYPPTLDSPSWDIYAFERTLKRTGRERLGWRWRDMNAIEVTHLSGGRTFAAIVGSAAAALVLAPFALLLGRGNLTKVPNIGGPGGGDNNPVQGTWDPLPAPAADVSAPSLFSTGARVRAIAMPIVALDASVPMRGGLVTSGALARIRLARMLDLGGGVREAFVNVDGRWTRSSAAVFQFGFHLPLDADERYAIAFGLDAGGGGELHHDVRFPLGVRYSRGRWSGTLVPAAPAHQRFGDEKTGSWSLFSGGELSAGF